MARGDEGKRKKKKKKRESAKYFRPAREDRRGSEAERKKKKQEIDFLLNVPFGNSTGPGVKKPACHALVALTELHVTSL